MSGHGPAVQAIADWVRGLMQQYLAALAQAELMRDLNRTLQLLDGVHYATTVALGWHSRGGLPC